MSRLNENSNEILVTEFNSEQPGDIRDADGLEALKSAIEAVGDAIAELAETSAAGSPHPAQQSKFDLPKIENEIKDSSQSEAGIVDTINVTPNEDEIVATAKVPPSDDPIKLSDTSDDIKAPDGAISREANQQRTHEHITENNEVSTEQRSELCALPFKEVATQTDKVIILDPDETAPIMPMENINLADDETLIEEEVEVDEDSQSQTSDDPTKPKKKKKLRILKKIKRGAGHVAYGAFFSAGALVGGTLVGTRAIGHGAKTGVEIVADTGGKIGNGNLRKFALGIRVSAEGTKELAIGAAHAVKEGTVKVAEGTKDTATSFAKASAGAVGDIFDVSKSGAELVADTATSGAHAVVDTTKAGAKLIVETTGKATDYVEEKARQSLIAAAEATAAGAQFAGYTRSSK